MNSAVRTVSENDDFQVIEGLAYPFKGRDTYGTFFSAKTDFHWDLFPDVQPGKAIRSANGTEVGQEPHFIRPVSYHHGFEPDMGLIRIGGWSPVRIDADGVWVQAQIDKRNKHYAARIKPLLEAGALGLSGDSAEHAVRIDERTLEVLDWPAYGVALTPVESNPLAQLAVRASDVITILAAEATRRDISTEERNAMSDKDFAGPNRSFPITQPGDVAAAAHSLGRAKGDTDSIKAKIIAIAKRKGAAFVAQLPDAWKGDGAAKSGEDVPEADTPATRAGARNSARDVTTLRGAHDSIASVLGMDCAEAYDEGQRSGEDTASQPAVIAVRENVQPTYEELAQRMAARAAEAGLEVVRRITG